jgi:alcohol dehydrogenase class IV
MQDPGGERSTWSYYNPTRVLAGISSLREIANTHPEARNFTIVVGSTSAKSNGYLNEVQEALAPRATATFSGISPEPTQTDVEGLRNYLATSRPDGVIALGGGSVLDVAKIACSAVESESSIAELMDRKTPVPPRQCALVAIPTTAGSGSELTPFVVLTNNSTGLKQSLPSPNHYPDLAILVPEFLRTVPRKVASDTGMDALAHAFEALWSIHNNPVSDALALRAITLISRHFIAYLDEPAEFEHANAMSIAAALAGKSFSNTLTAACHGLSYPIAARFNVSHGASCAVILDLIAKVNMPAVEPKYRVLCQLLSLQSPEDIPQYIASLRQATGCIPTFDGLHPTTEDVDSIIRDAFKPLMNNNPVTLDDAAIRQLLQGNQ